MTEVIFNEYGEKITITDDGIILHSDCDNSPATGVLTLNRGIYNNHYLVGNGHLFTISDDEYFSLCSILPEKQIHSIVTGKRDTRISGELCPICLTVKTEFDRHHVVWKSEGGSNSPENILLICRDCHARITKGDEFGRFDNLTAIYFMAMIYGFDFLRILNNKFVASLGCVEDEVKKSFHLFYQYALIFHDLDQKQKAQILESIGELTFYESFLKIVTRSQ